MTQKVLDVHWFLLRNVFTTIGTAPMLPLNILFTSHSSAVTAWKGPWPNSIRNYLIASRTIVSLLFHNENISDCSLGPVRDKRSQFNRVLGDAIESLNGVEENNHRVGHSNNG